MARATALCSVAAREGDGRASIAPRGSLGGLGNPYRCFEATISIYPSLENSLANIGGVMQSPRQTALLLTSGRPIEVFWQHPTVPPALSVLEALLINELGVQE
jgi:hypothetical protein